VLGAACGLPRWLRCGTLRLPRRSAATPSSPWRTAPCLRGRRRVSPSRAAPSPRPVRRRRWSGIRKAETVAGWICP